MRSVEREAVTIVMGPESILIFSLSILVIGGNPGTCTVLAHRNFHGDVKASGPHLESISKNDNGPYQEEADPKVASIASVAADASLDVTKSIAKEISDAIALAVANAVGKIFAEQSALSEQNSERLSDDTPVTSDDLKTNVNDDSKRADIGYRGLPIQESQEQSKVAYDDDDNESEPADSTSKFSKTSDTNQSKIEQSTFNHIRALASSLGVHINPTVSYEKSAAIVVHHRNNSRPIYPEPGNVKRRNQYIHEKQDDDDDPL